MTIHGKIYQMVEEKLMDAQLLQCNRAWSAWQRGTMSDKDFEEYNPEELLSKIQELEANSLENALEEFNIQCQIGKVIGSKPGDEQRYFAQQIIELDEDNFSDSDILVDGSIGYGRTPLEAIIDLQNILTPL